MSVFGLLAEGFESALLPCSLILLIPGVAVGFTARAAAIPAIASFSVAALSLSWIRFADRGGGFTTFTIAAALMVSVLLLLVPLINRLDLTAIAAGLLAGGAAAELWRPCVGAEYGQLLNELPARGFSGLGLQALYLFGTLSPLIALAALHHLVPDWILDKLEPAWSVVGGTVLAVLSVATAVGLHDNLVGKLFEWSLR